MTFRSLSDTCFKIWMASISPNKFKALTPMALCFSPDSRENGTLTPLCHLFSDCTLQRLLLNELLDHHNVVIIPQIPGLFSTPLAGKTNDLSDQIVSVPDTVYVIVLILLILNLVILILIMMS